MLRKIRFFRQSTEDKLKVNQQFSKNFNGYKGARQTNISHGEGLDVKESVGALRRQDLISIDLSNSSCGCTLLSMIPIQNLLMLFQKR
jgi:hypothetical protein